MIKQLHSFSGKLTYSDFGTYQLIYPGGGVNISSILSKVYHSPTNNKIHIKIMNGCKVLFNEEGNLLIRPETSTELYSYHINGECLETVMFYNTDKDLTFEITAEALEGLRDITYEQQIAK